MYPLKFIPAYKDYIWGGRNLEKLGKELPEGIVAEIWEVSAHKDGLSIVAEGELKGKTIPELISEYGEEFTGRSLSENNKKVFPLLIKLIDANDRLSVQVHPGDEYAFEHENGELGKNEMWYILSAEPGAKLIYDIADGVTKEAFAKAVEDNNIESCLKSIEVFPGDVINIPDGLVHAIGKGIVLAEIQQNSNTTYRVFDYNRKDKNGNSRPLHIEKSLDVIDFSSKGRKEKCTGLITELSDGGEKNNLIANKYFSVEKFNVKEALNENADGDKFYIYIFTEGSGVLEHNGKEYPFKKGESILIPASIGEYMLKGTFEMLKTYVPDVEKDVINPLKEKGFTEEEIRENVSGLC